MTDVGGSKVNILQLHLSPRPNGFSSAGAGGGYHQLSSLRLTSNIEWFNDSIMPLLTFNVKQYVYVSKDEFQFTLSNIISRFCWPVPWPTHFQSEKWQWQCDYCGHDKSLARVHHLLSPDIISHNQHLPLITLTAASRQLWLIWSFVVLRWCIMEYCELWQASDHNWTGLCFDSGNRS